MAAANNYHSNSTNNNNNNNNNKETAYMMHSATAHDWEDEKNRYKEFTDDGTMTFFWNAHTITVLVIYSCILVYVTLFEEVVYDSDYNKKRGITAAVLAFLLFGVIQTPDGPFRRPHPAFWRLVLVLSIVYELALVYILFQTVDDARQLMKVFDEDLGKELPEKSYGGNCLIYDMNSSEIFHNLYDKLDGFVIVHFFGWWIKTLVLRDWWLCLVISIMFEILEYTLEHQLPNFSECWWDHWVMDAVICNGAGIYLGMKTLRYLSLKPYHWRGMWDIPSYSGKMKRFAQQFTPYRWTDFEWKPLSSFKRWISMLCVITIFLIAELNTFYLKFVLWLAPDHYLCLGRLAFFILMGAVGMREGFQYLDDPNCKTFGRQSWITLAVILTELLIVIKFGWETVSKPLPKPVAYFWIIGFSSLVLWTIWRFLIKRDVKNDVPELDTKSDTKINSQKQKKAVLKNSNSSQVRHRVQKAVVDR